MKFVAHLRHSTGNRAQSVAHTTARPHPSPRVSVIPHPGATMRRMIGRAISKAAFCVALSLFGVMPQAQADEGGVSLWLPGTFGSLAATPQAPGWSLATVFLHVSARASGNVAAAREVTLGRFNRNVLVDLNVNLKADARPARSRAHLCVCATDFRRTACASV